MFKNKDIFAVKGDPSVWAGNLMMLFWM